MRYYITPQDLIVAEKNGISKKVANQRVYKYGWTVERAITTAVQKHIKNCDKWIKIARRHGIGSWTFQRRIRKGMSLTLAASYPKPKRGKKSQFSDRTIEKAKSNGIARTTFLQRVNKCGWSVKDALTIPAMTHIEIVQFSRQGKKVCQRQ